jgi:hypothetical protein
VGGVSLMDPGVKLLLVAFVGLLAGGGFMILGAWLLSRVTAKPPW